MSVHIYNNLTKEDIHILEKMHTKIKKEQYSKQDYENLCINVAEYYNNIKNLKIAKVSLDEYSTVIEKLYDFENLFITDKI